MSSILQRALGNNRHNNSNGSSMNNLKDTTTLASNHVDVALIPVEPLESLRTRLSQLTQSLAKLLDSLNSPSNNPNPADPTQPSRLPHFVSLQNQYNVINNQLVSIVQSLEAHQSVLLTHDAFPLPKFPTTKEQNLVTTLLRKKTVPEVVDWVNESMQLVDEQIRSNPASGNVTSLNDKFVDWCVQSMTEERDNYEFHGFQTMAELRDINNGASDNDVDMTKEEDEKAKRKEEELKKLAMSVNELLKFIYQGVDPRVLNQA
ncbi:hypothetical protein BABINDRAFT_5187 [Babjeviella inositovora NRRL Y-12698]|uniref:Mediator of RNA polymerase II transcription subunit 8 n=1 Tax=Babjeviella inositovora NRRL Y-12698 TaxID=984486 RepID=A0A1E3QYM2_9ASCO|nr:uncharacterized protein BABINDRAFT_5187 [Babjeviella inositovora NRRL Y-12698]ODQ82182.1 hypothetical protein BABINDRAFT_5187 [Babjeviella inositovora NRRL Y-12698]